MKLLLSLRQKLLRLFLTLFISYYAVGALLLSLFLPYLVFQSIDEQVTTHNLKKEYQFKDRTVIDRVYGRSSNAQCIIFFPGRKGGVFDYQSDIFPTFIHSGYTVHALSYPGYEGAKGTSNLTNIKEVIVSTVRQILNNGPCDPRQVVYIGRSLGATLALTVAEEITPSKIIIDSLGSNLLTAIEHELARRWYLRPLKALPLSYLITDIDSIELIEHLQQTQIILFQGMEDKQTPVSAIQKISHFENVKLIAIKGGTHANTHIKSLPLYQLYLSR